jgi:hypothetical protein
VLPAELELHGDLVHLADRTRDDLLVGFGVSAGILAYLRLGAVLFGARARDCCDPQCRAQENGQGRPDEDEGAVGAEGGVVAHAGCFS